MTLTGAQPQKGPISSTVKCGAGDPYGCPAAAPGGDNDAGVDSQESFQPTPALVTPVWTAPKGIRPTARYVVAVWVTGLPSRHACTCAVWDTFGGAQPPFHASQKRMVFMACLMHTFHKKEHGTLFR